MLQMPVVPAYSLTVHKAILEKGPTFTVTSSVPGG